MLFAAADFRRWRLRLEEQIMSTVHSRHYKRVFFLLELKTQCQLAERAFERLQKCAKAWLIGTEYAGEKGAPIEILHLVHSFLTYSAIMAKIIFERGRGEEKIIERCLDLQELLEINSSTHLAKLDVRNSLEHIDERFDEYLPGPPFSVEPLAVGTVEGREEKTVIRRFDPTELEFWFLQDCIQLRPLFEEIKDLKSKIGSAFEKFSET